MRNFELAIKPDAGHRVGSDTAGVVVDHAHDYPRPEHREQRGEPAHFYPLAYGKLLASSHGFTPIGLGRYFR